MAVPSLIVLIDMDPPSDEGDGSRGFYPPRPDGPLPPEARLRERFDACFDFVQQACGGVATLTVHTSPRFRDDFLRPPYLEVWRHALRLGCDLALHPHEDRPDGSNAYDDAGHMRGVIQHAMGAGLPFAAFRSGTFAFGPAVPALLAEAEIMVDLSALPDGDDAARNVAWSARRGPYVLDRGVLEIPIGWNGTGHDLGRDYLFNEKSSLAALTAIWDALCDAPEPPACVNFLCHGFGLVRPDWRAQAEEFLRHARASGGVIVAARDAAARFKDPS